MNRTEQHEALAFLAEPLWQAEQHLAKLDTCVRLGAPAIFADEDDVKALLTCSARIQKAVKEFHDMTAKVAVSRGMDIETLNQAAPRSGGTGKGTGEG